MSRIFITSLVLSFLLITTCFAQSFDYTNPPLQFQEQDGSPSTYPYRVVVPNTSLTDTATGSILSFITPTSGDASYLKLDQTTPQHIINDFPRFDAGIGIVGNYGLYWRDVADANTIAYVSYDGDWNFRTVGGASDITFDAGSGAIDFSDNDLSTTGDVNAIRFGTTDAQGFIDIGTNSKSLIAGPGQRIGLGFGNVIGLTGIGIGLGNSDDGSNNIAISGLGNSFDEYSSGCVSIGNYIATESGINCFNFGDSYTNDFESAGLFYGSGSVEFFYSGGICGIGYDLNSAPTADALQVNGGIYADGSIAITGTGTFGDIFIGSAADASWEFTTTAWYGVNYPTWKPTIHIGGNPFNYGILQGGMYIIPATTDTVSSLGLYSADATEYFYLNEDSDNDYLEIGAGGKSSPYVYFNGVDIVGTGDISADGYIQSGSGDFYSKMWFDSDDEVERLDLASSSSLFRMQAGGGAQIELNRGAGDKSDLLFATNGGSQYWDLGLGAGIGGGAEFGSNNFVLYNFITASYPLIINSTDNSVDFIGDVSTAGTGTLLSLTLTGNPSTISSAYPINIKANNDNTHYAEFTTFEPWGYYGILLNLYDSVGFGIHNTDTEDLREAFYFWTGAQETSASIIYTHSEYNDLAINNPVGNITFYPAGGGAYLVVTHDFGGIVLDLIDETNADGYFHNYGGRVGIKSDSNDAFVQFGSGDNFTVLDSDGNSVVTINEDGNITTAGTGTFGNITIDTSTITQDASVVSDFTIQNADLNKDILFSVNKGGSTKTPLRVVGQYAGLVGEGCTLTGDYGLALGNNTTAGNDAFAFGGQTSASGQYSVAFGFSSSASGGSSVAMGESSDASGSGAVAMGGETTASGEYSAALGYFTTASGDYSFAFGEGGDFALIASASNSFAFGSSFTNSTASSFAIGFGALDYLFTHTAFNFYDSSITGTGAISTTGTIANNADNSKHTWGAAGATDSYIQWDATNLEIVSSSYVNLLLNGAAYFDYPSYTSGLTINDKITATNQLRAGMATWMTATADQSSGGLYGFFGGYQDSGASAVSVGSITAASGYNYLQGTNARTFNYVYGGYFYTELIANNNITFGDIYGIYVKPCGSGYLSGDNSYAGYFAQPGSKSKSGGTGFTNNYGLYIEETTVGSTINNEIFIAGAGEVFFRDQALHIGSGSDGWINITADTGVEVNAPILNVSALYVAGDTYSIGDTWWEDDGSGIPYGSCYGNEIGWTQTSAAQNTWYNISDTDMTDGELNLATHDGSGKLTVTKAGRYIISYSASTFCSANNAHIETGIEISGSGSANNAGICSWYPQTANAEGVQSGVAIIDLAASATIEVCIRTVDAGTPTLGVNHLNIVCQMVGGT